MPSHHFCSTSNDVVDISLSGTPFVALRLTIFNVLALGASIFAPRLIVFEHFVALVAYVYLFFDTLWSGTSFLFLRPTVFDMFAFRINIFALCPIVFQYFLIFLAYV